MRLDEIETLQTNQCTPKSPPRNPVRDFSVAPENKQSTRYAQKQKYKSQEALITLNAAAEAYRECIRKGWIEHRLREDRRLVWSIAMVEHGASSNRLVLSSYASSEILILDL